jgi:hypothetical protein
LSRMEVFRLTQSGTLGDRLAHAAPIAVGQQVHHSWRSGSTAAIRLWQLPARNNDDLQIGPLQNRVSQSSHWWCSTPSGSNQ